MKTSPALTHFLFSVLITRVITASACLHFGPLWNSHEASHYSCHYLAETTTISSVICVTVAPCHLDIRHCAWVTLRGCEWCEWDGGREMTGAKLGRRGSLRGRARPETQPQWADTDQRQAWSQRRGTTKYCRHLIKVEGRHTLDKSILIKPFHTTYVWRIFQNNDKASKNGQK